MASFIIDIGVLIYLGYNAFDGYKNGFLLSLITLTGIVCSYLGAYTLGPVMGNIIHNQYDSSKLISMVIGSMIVFFIIALLFNSAKNYLILKDKKNVKQKKPKKISTSSRLAGATIKLSVALIMASVAIWSYSLLRVSPIKSMIPAIDASISLNVSRSIINQAAYMIVSKIIPEKDQARRIANLISRPEKSLNNVNNVVNNPKMREMFADQSFRDDLLSGDQDKILANEKFSAVLEDKALMEQVKSLDATSTTDSDEYKKQFAAKMATMGSKIKVFIDDPEVKENIKSLKADGLLKSNNIKALLTDSRFMNLADKFIAEK
jgi:uncharacterized membrane protein YeaQ/YmgE (transglycosylase-associated protein family)